MSRFKDWQLGEWRIHLKCVTATGSTIEIYAPHLDDAQGAAVLLAARGAMMDLPLEVSVDDQVITAGGGVRLGDAVNEGGDD